MQAQVAQSCSYCKGALRGNAMRYLLADMDEEMMAWVELKLRIEVNQSSCLCEKCFTNFQATWAALQEPEVEFSAAGTSAVHDPDPLAAINKFHLEETNLKIEEPKSFEHYDYKIEIDTSIPNATESDLNIEKSCTKAIENKNDEVMSSDEVEETFDDGGKPSESDKQEISSDDENPVVGGIPPILHGSSLRCGTKCDWCMTLLTNKDYRKLPDGLEKDFIVTKIFERETSPERVCDPCWTKAHARARIQFRSIRKTRSNPEPEPTVQDDQPTDSITIPTYQRFPSSSSRCIVMGCKNQERLRIPDYLRCVWLKSYNLFASETARICKEHSKEYHRDWSFLKRDSYITLFNAKDVTEMLDLLRNEALKQPE